MGKPANDITDYLLLHLSKEIPHLDVWRNARVDAMARAKDGRTIRIKAGEDGQADLTGHYGWPAADGRPLVNRRCEIEVKSPSDQQGPRQKDFERRCLAHGSLYILAQVRRRETVDEIVARLSLGKRAPAGHPAEIQTFIDEMRRRLTS